MDGPILCIWIAPSTAIRTRRLRLRPPTAISISYPHGRAGESTWRFIAHDSVDGKYQEAEKLKGPVNDEENSSLEVLVAPDESYLLLVPFGRKDGYGSFDIYVSEQHDGQWGAPRNLGPKVNTAGARLQPAVFAGFGKYRVSVLSSERGLGTTAPQASR